MSSTGGVPYLGSKISLISKSEIRYEGILYTIDTKDSTVALSKVRSYGTEDRPTDRPVAPREEVYEYIIFRGADIKDIRVCQPPKPQPTLEGGLPNDPAIVHHSVTTKPSGGANAAAGSSSYGAIGSSGYAPSAPGAPFSSGPSSTTPQPHSGSPVMDMLNHHSGRSSPNQGHDSKSPTNLEGRPSSRGRGGSAGFYRGGRGRGVNQGGNQSFRGRGGPGGRGGFQPGRPTATKKDTLKFEGEYDFDKANEEFKEVLEKLQKSTLEPKGNGETEAESNEVEEGEVVPEPESSGSPIPEIFYDKKKSFFDSISCEATEKSKGRSNRPDWKAEKKLNRETFGVAGHMGRRGYNRRGGNNYGYNRGGGYNNYGGGGNGRGGYYNNYNQGQQHQQQGGERGEYNNFSGRFARDGNNFRGGRGRGGYNGGYEGRGGYQGGYEGRGGYGGRGQRVGGRGGNWRNQED